METAGNLNSYLQTLKKPAKIPTTNANKQKIEKRNIFWATEKYRTYISSEIIGPLGKIKIQIMSRPARKKLNSPKLNSS